MKKLVQDLQPGDVIKLRYFHVAYPIDLDPRSERVAHAKSYYLSDFGDEAPIPALVLQCPELDGPKDCGWEPAFNHLMRIKVLVLGSAHWITRTRAAEMDLWPEAENK